MATTFAVVATARAGERLYNGIVLPDVWPPKTNALGIEPALVPYLKKPPEVIPIDVGRQLFVDDFLIEETNLQRVCHTAEPYPGNPVVKADRPWEDAGKGPTAAVFSDGVWYDPGNRLFKMWYMAPYLQSTCYAVSSDGIHWDKPLLNVVPGTNIVLNTAYRDSCTVWLDLEERDPSRRYKMTLYEKSPRQGGLSIRFSADGIHWGDVAAWAGPVGDRTTIFYNPFRKMWVYSIRGAAAVGGTKDSRVRYYREGVDLLAAARWTEGEQVLWVGADRLDPRRPGLDVEPQLYNLDAVAYESLMLGLFSIWQGPSNEACRDQAIPKRNEILLGFSRDGFHWHRPDRRPFIGVDEAPGSWAAGNVQSAGGGCLIVGDKLFFYFSGRAQCGNKNWDSCASTGLATLRRDGFASMDADHSKGTLTTRLVRFSGKYLFVNADVGAGELRVEVLNQHGKLIQPLSRDNCLPVHKNGTLQAVKWRGVADLSGVADQPVRLRFHLTRGRLYSFWVSPDLSGASRGYVAAGGPGFSAPVDTMGAR